MLVSDTNDLSIILDIQKEAFSEEAIRYDDFSMPPMLQTLDQIIEEYNEGTIFFKYIQDDKLVGSVRGKLVNDVCFVGRLVVLPTYQGQGVAKNLMKELELFFHNRCSSFEIFTGEKSIRPLNLYTKLGYLKTKEIPSNDYFIIVMRKENPVEQLYLV